MKSNKYKYPPNLTSKERGKYCRKMYMREYNKRPEVKARVKEYNKDYNKSPEAKTKFNEYLKEYQKRPYVKDRLNKHKKINRANNPEIRLKENLRCRINIAIQTYSESGKIMTSKEYGINYKKIIEHLKPFPDNISEYHVDHVIPLSWFNFSNPHAIAFAFSPGNHQWMKIKNNLLKSNKYACSSSDINKILSSYSLSDLKNRMDSRKNIQKLNNKRCKKYELALTRLVEYCRMNNLVGSYEDFHKITGIHWNTLGRKKNKLHTHLSKVNLIPEKKRKNERYCDCGSVLCSRNTTGLCGKCYRESVIVYGSSGALSRKKRKADREELKELRGMKKEYDKYFEKKENRRLKRLKKEESNK